MNKKHFCVFHLWSGAFSTGSIGGSRALSIKYFGRNTVLFQILAGSPATRSIREFEVLFEKSFGRNTLLFQKFARSFFPHGTSVVMIVVIILMTPETQ